LDADASNIVATIERMYAAVGRDDREALNGVLAPDFHAFENGVAMSGSDLLKLMSRLYADGKRYRRSVTSPQVEVQGNLGAVVYLNVGSVVEAPGAEPTALSWLETVLLRREASGWRVAFLHSPRAIAQRTTGAAPASDSVVPRPPES
jgi:ketosteroid isomerase-like protein